MGLDMYLNARRYVSGYGFSLTGRDPDEERNEYERLVELFDVRDAVDPETPSAYVEFCVAYWRKANQIHAWFVEHVQGGVDECQRSYVSRERLVELRDLCLRVMASTELVDGQVHTGTVYSAEHPQGAVQLAPGKIMADPRVAHDLLPTQDGFFFGGTDYDEGYWYDLTQTVEQIDRALKLSEYWEFEYQASW